jgi:hypothetical protein
VGKKERPRGFRARGTTGNARKNIDAKRSSARKYAPGRAGFANLDNLPNPFANLLEDGFCGFAKNQDLPSAFANLLEML